MVGIRGGMGRIVAMSAALVVVALLVLAGTARAGNYRVAQCGWGVGAELDPVPVTEGRGFLLGPAFCVPPPGVEPQGLRFEATPGLENDPGMVRARWVTPPGTALTAIRAAWAGIMQPGFEATLGVDVGTEFRPLANAAGSSAYGPVAFEVPGAAWAFEARMGCGGGAVAVCSRQRASWLSLSGLTLTVLDPSAPAARVAGPLLGGGWRRGTVLLEAGADDIGSGVDRLEATVDGAPVLDAPQSCAVLSIEGETRATQMRPCPVTAARTVEVDTTKFPDGAHTVHACATDFGGSIGCAADARIEVDNSAPAVAFGKAQEGGVAATVSDGFSGPAGGAISVRRADADGWTDLPTTFSAGASGTATLTARLPEMSAGTWVFKATASDAVGNAGASELTVAGSAVELRRLAAAGGGEATDRGRTPRPRGHGRGRVSIHTGGRSTHLRAELGMATPRGGRPRSSSLSALTVGFGAPVMVRGRLTDSGRLGIEGRSVTVVSQSARGARPRRTIRRVGTDGDGRFRVRLPAGPSRRVVVIFPGGDGLASSRSEPLALRVGAAVSLAARPRRLATGESVALSGRVRSGAARIPSRGKVVTIQYLERESHRWRPALVVRTDSSGAFKAHYRFRYITDEAHIHLRAAVLPEAGWPYAEGSSRPVTVTVHG